MSACQRTPTWSCLHHRVQLLHVLMSCRITQIIHGITGSKKSDVYSSYHVFVDGPCLDLTGMPLTASCSLNRSPSLSSSSLLEVILRLCGADDLLPYCVCNKIHYPAAKRSTPAFRGKSKIHFLAPVTPSPAGSVIVTARGLAPYRKGNVTW